MPKDIHLLFVPRAIFTFIPSGVLTQKWPSVEQDKVALLGKLADTTYRVSNFELLRLEVEVLQKLTRKTSKLLISAVTGAASGSTDFPVMADEVQCELRRKGGPGVHEIVADG